MDSTEICHNTKHTWQYTLRVAQHTTLPSLQCLRIPRIYQHIKVSNKFRLTVGGIFRRGALDAVFEITRLDCNLCVRLKGVKPKSTYAEAPYFIFFLASPNFRQGKTTPSSHPIWNNLLEPRLSLALLLRENHQKKRQILLKQC